MSSENDDNLDITILPDDEPDITITANASHNQVNSRYLKCIVKDYTGGKVATVGNIPSDMYLVRLVPILVQKMYMMPDVKHSIMHKESGRVLNPSETLAQAGVQNGDTLRLVHLSTFGTSPSRLQLVDAILSGQLENSEGQLQGLFFYSSNDHYLPIHIYLCGQLRGRFFLVYEPIRALKPAFASKLGNLYGLYQNAFINNNKMHYKPVSYENLEKIAQYFGVDSAKLPCIFVYRGLSSKTGLIIEHNFWGDMGTSFDQNLQKANIYPYELHQKLYEWATKENLPTTGLSIVEMETSVIEAIAFTVNLLDKDLGS